MESYTPEQTARIRHAIVKGREAMRINDRFDALTFAHAYIENQGIQIPGAPDNEAARQHIAQQIIAALRADGAGSDSPDVTRELRRIHAEAHWASEARSDNVVGFRLELGPRAANHPECQMLANSDHGLGAAVFRKVEVVILPPACMDSTFVPVLEHEIEQ